MTPAHRTKEAPRAAAFPGARATRRVRSSRLKTALSLGAVQSLIAGAARLSLPQNADAEALSLRAGSACIDATEALDRLWVARPRPGRDARTRGSDAIQSLSAAVRTARDALVTAKDFDECIESTHAANLLELALTRLAAIGRALERDHHAGRREK